MIETNEAVAVVTVGLIALVPAIDTVKRWFGAGDKRQIQQPLIVKPDAEYAPLSHDHPQYMLRKDCPDRHREDEARQLRAMTDLKTSLERLDVKIDRYNVEDEERAKELHGRITGLVEPLGVIKGRLDDHIHDVDKHGGKR